VTRRIVVPAIFGVVGVAILLALGLWQVQRLAWKEGLIADIEARLAADPLPVPGDPDPVRDRLLRVEATGLIGRDELHVLSSLKPWGAGYRIVSPMSLADGRRILVDLGFVPQDMKDPAARPGAPAAGPAAAMGPGRAPDQVTGLLLWPAETDSFTPEPELVRNIWFARDVPRMAEALGTEPVLLVAESFSGGEWPKPAPPGTDLPNRHLEYAVTWFGLAAAWAGMTVFWIRTELRGRPGMRPGAGLHRR
jgi:surfeit locus 1 family protein